MRPSRQHVWFGHVVKAADELLLLVLYLYVIERRGVEDCGVVELSSQVFVGNSLPLDASLMLSNIALTPQ